MTAVKSSDLKDNSFQFFYGDGAMRIFDKEGLKFAPNVNVMPLKLTPRIRAVPEFDSLFDESLFYRFRDDSAANLRVRERVREAIERARDATERARDAHIIRTRVVPRVTIRT